MGTDKLPVAVIGVGGFGALTLEALAQVECVRIVGLSDKNSQAAEQAARAASAPAYTDNRSLLVETKPKAVFLAVPPTAAPELLSACADRGIHVWQELPLGRDLSEGVAHVRRMEKAKLKLAVGTQRRFAAGYALAGELKDKIAPIFLARSHYLFNWGRSLGWRGDKSAGGGALQELGYHLIDLLLSMLGFPEEVYGQCAGANRSQLEDPEAESLPVYDTDDTATAMLRYSDGCMATIVASRSSGPVSEELNLHGRGGSIKANSEACLLSDPDGNILDQVNDPSPLAAFGKQAEAFALAVLNDSKTYRCSGRENLLNLAVIESIYLSSQTGSPENAQKLLRAHGLTVQECLKLTPCN